LESAALKPAPGPGQRSQLSNADLATRLNQAEAHRRSAITSAKALLKRVESKESERPATPDTAALAPAIVAEEAAFASEVGEAAAAAETESANHLARLKTAELKLFGFVMIVLVLEGFFVISPAVRKIRHFMTEMSQTHEELKSYAAKLEVSNKELQDFA